MPQPPDRRLRRLAEELEESGFLIAPSRPSEALLLEEIDAALRPEVHERRVASSGCIIDPAAAPTSWPASTHLQISKAPIDNRGVDAARPYADGLSSWLLRRTAGADEFVMFDRPAGSERDLVILATAFAGTLVQRHPSGSVRIVGEFGVLRWNGFAWHHEPPVASWIGAVGGEGDDTDAGDRGVLGRLLQFAVHDLGSLGIGALLIYRPQEEPGPPVEEIFPAPPPLQIRTAFHLAPLRHALGQVDGAAVFDRAGVLRQLGVRIIASRKAEDEVQPLGGTRHTAARRYSYDDPGSTVIAVSADGPVSVFRAGAIAGRSS